MLNFSFSIFISRPPHPSNTFICSSTEIYNVQEISLNVNQDSPLAATAD